MKEYDLKKAVQNISLSPEARGRIMEKVMHPDRRKEKEAMMSRKKILIAAMAAVMMIGGTVLASGKITTWYSSSSSLSAYKDLPTAAQCKKDAGFTPVLIRQFKNGYTYTEGNVVDNQMGDDAGNIAERFKSLDFTYEKSGDEVYLSQERYKTHVDSQGQIVGKIKGKDLYYYSYRNKFVPGDYELTEEDKQAEESGELVFSYGTDEVEIMTVQTLSWSDGDMHYSLMQMDGKLSREELIRMAEEIIR